MDAFVTSEGRRQFFKGQFRVQFVSFTDMHTFYESEESPDQDGFFRASDAQDRIFFEASNRPQDQIILESDLVGQIQNFSNKNLRIIGNKIISGTNTAETKILTGAQVLSAANEIMQATFSHFNEQLIIGSDEQFIKSREFSVSPSEYDFIISNDKPINVNDDIITADISEIESVFNDFRFQNLPYFDFLPPKNVPSPEAPGGAPIGIFKDTRQLRVHSFSELEQSLNDKEFVEISMYETSEDNNVLIQVTEECLEDFQKLLIVDFGEFDLGNGQGIKRVFFAGKAFFDSANMPTFVNIFTIVME